MKSTDSYYSENEWMQLLCDNWNGSDSFVSGRIAKLLEWLSYSPKNPVMLMRLEERRKGIAAISCWESCDAVKRRRK